MKKKSSTHESKKALIQVKRKRKGVHAKTKTSRSKRSKLYQKKYRGQG